jgi:outer membrane protein assembly factor BamD (BamD/ComL family)
VAEAYFELAKKHRQLGQDELVEQEIATGKRMLEEALRDYPDTEARAQVDYLLANLSLEFAEEADDEATKKEYFLEALSRFSSIVSNYRDSTYAPKAQFKKALTLEQMGEIERASEEYVKLSYRWPDSPLIAETIARLGQYFYGNGIARQKSGAALLKEGTALAEQAETLQDAAEAEKARAASTEKLLEAEKARVESIENFTTAAKVFGRLAVRFPSHRLAAKTTALSGQCFIRAKLYDDAVTAFRKVIENEKADKEVRAESLYWAADSYMRKVAEGIGRKDANLKEAYLLFKNLTLYYPESNWARYARGRLAGEDLIVFDTPPEEEES